MEILLILDFPRIITKFLSILLALSVLYYAVVERASMHIQSARLASLITSQVYSKVDPILTRNVRGESKFDSEVDHNPTYMTKQINPYANPPWDSSVGSEDFHNFLVYIPMSLLERTSKHNIPLSSCDLSRSE